MKLLRILFLALSLTTTMLVKAYDFEANGLYFDILSTGDLTCTLVEGSSPYTGALIIPDEVEYSGKKLKVVKIGCALPEVSSVKFSKNIESGYSVTINCFKDNKFLTSAEWPEEMFLSNGMFDGCVNLKNLSYQSICKRIPYKAFKGCTSLTTIDLSSVEKIEEYAFEGCKSLDIIDLSSIVNFYYYDPSDFMKDAFKDCGNISLLVLGPNVNYFIENPWKNCVIDSLAILPNSEYGLTFNRKIFFKETSIKKLYLGRELQVASVDFRGYTDVFSGQEELTFARVNYLGDNMFASCVNLKHVVLEGGGGNLLLQQLLQRHRY